MKNFYRFFVQPQIDSKTNSIMGYELLLKQYLDQKWQIPASFSAIDYHTIADLLIKTTKVLSFKAQHLSINVNRDQLMTTDISKAIIQCQKQLYPTIIIVELTEQIGSTTYSLKDVSSHLKMFFDNNIPVSLDDVGSGINRFEDIQQLLPFAYELKFALQNFQSDFVSPDIQSKVHFWRAMSQEYGIRLVLEGIETQNDDKLSSQMGITFKQGYYFGKPRLVKLPEDQDSCLA